jgi:hypothetical protein
MRPLIWFIHLFRPIANQEPLLKIHYRQEWILRSCDSGGMCNSFGYIALHTSLFINTSLIDK